VDEAAMRALAERYGVRDASGRLVSAVRRLASFR
jgi:hypothetical protein